MYPFSSNSYWQWVSRKFSEDMIGDSSLSGPEADPNQDGVPNLLHHSSATDPLSSVHSGPILTIAKGDDFINNGEFVLVYNRLKNRIDSAVSIEMSRDGRTWEPFVASNVETVDIGNEETPVERVTTSVSAEENGETVFFRLRAIQDDG